MIEFKNVTAVQDSKKLLDGMCFKLYNGKIYGILADKELSHEIAMLLTGAKTPAEGSVQINGFDLWREPLRAKSYLAFIPSETALYLDITPLEYLLFCIDVRQIDYEHGIRRIGKALSSVGLSHKRNVLIKTLSTYEKKCLTLAQALLSSADVLVFDEPFADLGATDAEAFSELIEAVAPEKTLFLCASEPKYFKRLCAVTYRATASELSDIESNSKKEDET